MPPLVRSATSLTSRASSSFSEIPLTSHDGSSNPSFQADYMTSSSRLEGKQPSTSCASYTSRPSTFHGVSPTISNPREETISTSQLNEKPPNINRGRSYPVIRNRPRTAASTIGGGESQQIICALSEARGVSPTVGISFVNISTGEAVLSQICDNQFYARVIHKLQVFEPSEILISSSCIPPSPNSTLLYSLIEEHVMGVKIIPLDRGYWNETAGHDYISQLAFKEDVEAIKVAIGGNYFAVCCLAAALKYVNIGLSLTFAFHSLRMKFQPSEDSMMIDLSTIQSLELIQNIQNVKSKGCLFGLLNETLTPMGSRLLRSNILQPSTQKDILIRRYDAVDEFQTKEEMFSATRQALKPFVDVEKLLTYLVITPSAPDIAFLEQRVNNILVLKNFILAVGPVFEAIASARSQLLSDIRNQCRHVKILSVMRMISKVINDDVTYQKNPLDLRNQRTYAVKSGLNGLLDVARVTYKEATADVHQHIAQIIQKYEIQLETRYDNARRYFLRAREVEFEGREIPDVLINRFRKKGFIECQTIDLVKLNQRIQDSHQEVVMMSDKTVEDLVEEIGEEIPTLFKICECIAMLDMLAAFAQVVISHDYCRPELTDSLVIGSARHPVREIMHSDRFIPNDIYATQQTRFQIITGCNMSGKSTYIRSIALMSVMAQIGCFVPAQYASFPIVHQLFARVSMDDCIEANVSTFAAEMRETAFILRNIDSKSLAIIDELGRGTSTRDGLAIALSIAEALVSSKALVWFATHFRELAQIMQERLGVVNSHFAVDMTAKDRMTMLYKLTAGFAKEEHYGLALARVIDLPPRVLEVAQKVSLALEAQAAAKKRSSRTSAIAKRRKLLLALHETLKQARDGPMEGKVLLNWLRKIQEEFVTRMEKIDRDAAAGDIEGKSVAEDGYEELVEGHDPASGSSESLG